MSKNEEGRPCASHLALRREPPKKRGRRRSISPACLPQRLTDNEVDLVRPFPLEEVERDIHKRERGVAFTERYREICQD